MVRDKYTFKSDGDFLKPPEKSIDAVLDDTRRVDDALLHALSLVLASNTEYARSVSALLETDMTREQTFNEMNSASRELLDRTQKLIESQEQLKELLDSLSDEYREVMEIIVRSQLETQQQYIDEKFKTLFKAQGLPVEGMTKWQRFLNKLKGLLKHELGLLLIGAVLYHLIIILLRYFGVN